MTRLVYGANFVQINFDEFPLEVDVPDRGNDPWTREYRAKLRRPVDVRAVRSFFGHDRGDAFEMSATVYADPTTEENSRYYLWDRIEEDTAPTGQARRMDVLPAVVNALTLKIQFMCRVTGKNMAVEKPHGSYQRWRGVFDCNLTLITEEVP